MYKIFADGDLIYDSTLEDFKIGKGSGTLETNKAGSFTFSVYPEHPWYDRFVKKKTVILVTKSDKVLFRGRVLDDKVDLWNRREVICEGELNFLQDSVIRPYRFTGTPEEAFRKYVMEHNAQVDEFKRFRIGQVTVYDPNNYIARSNSGYESALKNLGSRLLEDSLGGYLHITHGDDGTDPVPTLHYLADFPDISTQTIEFGANLKDYLKKSTGQTIATAIIPLGAKQDDGNPETEDPRLTIADVNDGLDYVCDEAAVAAHGWIFDTVIFDDVTLPENLKDRGLAELARRIREDITVELTAVDLHLLDRSIESFRCGTYVRVVSPPHNFAETLLCHRQTFNLLKPDSDTVTLGNQRSSFTGSAAKTAAAVAAVPEVQNSVRDLSRKTAAYKIAEQQLTSLLAQSFGIFKTEEVLEDGSTIAYLHDKPTLADSTNIWKMTGDAMAVSSDGGQTWNAGVDAEGNAIYNILSAIGIEADWIRADNLSAISANLGGWQIDEAGIFKEAVDPDNAENVYRVHIKAPVYQNTFFLPGNDIISCMRSTNSGKTFKSAFKLQADGTVTSGDVGGGNYATLSDFIISVITDNGSTFIDEHGISTYSPSGKKLTEMYSSNDSGIVYVNGSNGNYSYLNQYGVHVANANGTVPAFIGRTGSGLTQAVADEVRSADGLWLNVTLGDIKFTYKGGILVKAVYV